MTKEHRALEEEFMSVKPTTESEWRKAVKKWKGKVNIERLLMLGDLNGWSEA